MSQILAIPADALARMNMLVNASRASTKYSEARQARRDDAAEPSESSLIKTHGETELSLRIKRKVSA